MKENTTPLAFQDAASKADAQRLAARLRKQASRAKAGKAKSVTVELTEEEFSELEKLSRHSRRGTVGFWKRALILGALFAGNAGQGERFKLADLPALKAALQD